MPRVNRRDLLAVQLAAVATGSVVVGWGARNDEPFVTAVGAFACLVGIGAIYLNLEKR
jgi:hypothetical protein